MSQLKFNDKWLDIAKHQEWLRKTCNSDVYCRYCDQVLRNKSTVLPEHANSEKHKGRVLLGKTYSFSKKSRQRSTNTVASGNNDGIGSFLNFIGDKLRKLPADQVTNVQIGMMEIVGLTEKGVPRSVVNDRVVENVQNQKS